MRIVYRFDENVHISTPMTSSIHASNVLTEIRVSIFGRTLHSVHHTPDNVH